MRSFYSHTSDWTYSETNIVQGGGGEVSVLKWVSCSLWRYRRDVDGRSHRAQKSLPCSHSTWGPLSPGEGEVEVQVPACKGTTLQCCGQQSPSTSIPQDAWSRRVGFGPFLIMTILSTWLSWWYLGQREPLFRKQAAFTRKGNSVHLLIVMPESFGCRKPLVIGREN